MKGPRALRKPLILAFAGLVVGSATLGWWLWQHGTTPSSLPFTRPPQPLGIWVEGTEAVHYQKEATTFLQRRHFTVSKAPSQNQADIVLSSNKPADTSWPVTHPVGEPLPLRTDTILQKEDSPIFYVSAKKSNEPDAKALANELTEQAKKSPEWSLTTVGDIIIGRTVYKKVKHADDPNLPFAPFAKQLASSDLTLANLENAFATQPTYPEKGMTFIAPPAFAKGFTSAGIDAVNVANNHSYNAGEKGFKETLSTLDGLRIGYFGGGLTAEAARKPLIKEVKGVKVALLGYSSIAGSESAGEKKAGQNVLQMAPWGKLQEGEMARMSEDITQARTQADIVLVYYHWGQEYTHVANNDQRTVAHRAIDAGADMIIGTHPHWVQGLEWYKGKLIAYSLGNFVFDQEWSTETKQGFFINFTFRGTQPVAAKLVPYQIEDYVQPRPVSQAAGQKILNDAYRHSWWSLP